MGDSIFTNRIPRDRWDRPGILQANGKQVWYRRTTKFISQLEDTYNLEKWSQRMVALGMGQRPDLVLAAASLTDGDDDRNALDDVAEQAKHVAQASSKATKGTALHKICQRIDEGTPVEQIAIPPAHVDDVKAYLALKESFGLVYELIECMRVYDPWKVAGTPDRTGFVQKTGKWYIIDLKTGDIDWNDTQREIAQQLAMYAHSTAYDPDQEARPGFKNGRFPDPAMIDRRRAIVIHLPSGEGRCELHWVDIEKGWEGVQLSKKVWDWRKVSGLFVPAEEGVFHPPAANHLYKLAQNNTYEELAMMAQTEDELRDVWRRAAAASYGNTVTESFQIAVKTRLEQLKSQKG